MQVPEVVKDCGGAARERWRDEELPLVVEFPKQRIELDPGPSDRHDIVLASTEVLIALLISAYALRVMLSIVSAVNISCRMHRQAAVGIQTLLGSFRQGRGSAILGSPSSRWKVQKSTRTKPTT